MVDSPCTICGETDPTKFYDYRATGGIRLSRCKTCIHDLYILRNSTTERSEIERMRACILSLPKCRQAGRIYAEVTNGTITRDTFKEIWDELT